MKKYTPSLIVIIALALFIPAVKQSRADHSHAPVARKGVLNTGHWLTSHSEPLKLNGQWEFYWGALLSPDDFRNNAAPEKTGFLTMPSVWNDTRVNGKKLGGAGFATFRLELRLPPDHGRLGLLLPYTFTAYRLWINDRLAAESGRVGKSAAAMEPRYVTRVAVINAAEKKPTQLILQISNFAHAKGGIRDPIRLVPASRIPELKNKHLVKEVLVFGCLIIMSIYHLALFAYRHQDRYNLYFAIICLLFGVRAGLTGEVFLESLVPDLNWWITVRLEWLCAYVAGPLGLAFVHSLFPHESSERLHRACLVLASVMGMAVLVAPPIFFTSFFFYYIGVIGLILVVTIWILAKAARYHRPGALVMLIVFLIVTVTTVNDMLYTSDLIHTGHLIPYGMIFFVFSQAMILATRSARTFHRLEVTNAAYELEMIERERAEAEVKAYQGKLEELVRERTGELAVANQRLRLELEERKAAEAEKLKLQGRLQRAQKMEALGTLAGGVAHDLNNILSGLVGYPDLLLQSLPPESNLQKPLQTIQNSGLKAAAIVQDLLTLARRGVSDYQVVDLNQIVEEYLQSPEFEKLIQFHVNVAVDFSPARDLMHMKGSPVHLLKTVMNLVSNAAEAMPRGGDIRILTENRYLDRAVGDYDTAVEGEYVVLIVEDQGIGISNEDLEQIFEPFYTKKVMGKSGTGLGMAVVWGTVKDHSGYIDAKSREGTGTTFTLYFPATRDTPKEAADTWSLDDHLGNGETVLVVDDVAEQRDIAASMLEKLGYRAKTVASGEAALEHLAKNPVDLLVLDMIMEPGIDGLETYQRILEIRSGQKAVIASGFAETDRVRKAQALGAGAYLKKPYRLESMAEAVRTTLDG